MIKTVYVSIGNSDDRLSQAEWNSFFICVRALVTMPAEEIHGVWVSESTAPFQNAAFCFEIDEKRIPEIKQGLSEFAKYFRQDSIAWAVAETEFIGPPSVGEQLPLWEDGN